MKVNFGLVAVKYNEDKTTMDVLHFVGYEFEPTQEDYDSLELELKTDESFGLQHMNDYTIIPASCDMVKFFKPICENK